MALVRQTIASSRIAVVSIEIGGASPRLVSSRHLSSADGSQNGISSSMSRENEPEPEPPRLEDGEDEDDGWEP